MNAQLIVSYITKGCLLVLPMLVTFGLLSQATVDAIMALVNQLPDVALWVMNLAAFAGAVMSLARTWKNYAAK